MTFKCASITRVNDVVQTSESSVMGPVAFEIANQDKLTLMIQGVFHKIVAETVEAVQPDDQSPDDPAVATAAAVQAAVQARRTSRVLLARSSKRYQIFLERLSSTTPVSLRHCQCQLRCLHQILLTERRLSRSLQNFCKLQQWEWSLHTNFR